MLNATMFIGDASEKLAIEAKKYNKNSFLIDKNNYQSVLSMPSNCEEVVFYTSLEDLVDIDIFYQLALLCNKIFYFRSKNFTTINACVTDFDFSKNPTLLVEYSLFKLSKEKEVIGLEDLTYKTNEFRTLVDSRKTDNPQLWSVGCSHTYGVGVDKSQRYGQLLAEKIQLPVSFLAQDGSSTAWAADQILRSDIRKNDTVVWGVAYPSRMPIWHNDEILHVNVQRNSDQIENFLKSYKLKDIKRILAIDHMYYDSIIHIDQVINYCKKIDAKLFIMQVVEVPELSFYYRNTKEFLPFIGDKICMRGNFVDKGTDGRHGGPIQHQLFADFCYKNLKRLGHVT